MNEKRLLVALLSTLSLSVAGLAVAADQGTPPHGLTQPKEARGKDMTSCHEMMGSMHGGMMGGGMMGGGMMGGGMMGGGMMKNSEMMPALPPGNEKLAMQMHAEMMQAMGAILQKYADRVVPLQGK